MPLREETQTNAASVEADIRRILPDAKVLNNAEHIRAMTAVDLVRDVGKHVRINTLLRLDSIAGRLDSQEGISFTEFSYCLLQAADFLWLHQTEVCIFTHGCACVLSPLCRPDACGSFHPPRDGIPRMWYCNLEAVISGGTSRSGWISSGENCRFVG